MMTRGCYICTLLVSYVLSIPVPSDQVEKDDIKVMKCIVEVIADTLNKPHPIAISQECQESLTGDERIVSILRHQNLLKELQEIAADGVSERVHQQPQKKNEEVSDQVTDALGGPPDVEDTTERSMAREGAAESGHTAEGDNEVEEESREKSGESREGNEIGGTNEGEVVEETEENKEGEVEEKEEENSMIQGQEEEEQEEDEKETAQVEEEETHSSSGEEEGKGKEGNETEEEDSTQVNKDGETEPTKGASAAESDEKRSKQEEEEEAEDEKMEGEPENKRHFEGADKKSDEDEATEEREGGPGFQRWSKRGEESTHKTSEGAEAGEHTGAQGRNPMGEKQGSPQLLWHAPHHSKNSREGERRSPAAQELHMMAHGETEEEKREEEGSASHRGEDGEIARLAAIESELESVAQRLHELRSG